MTILVVGHPGDQVCATVVDELLAISPLPPTWVDPTELCAGRVAFRSCGGQTVWSVATNRTMIRSEELVGVLNRAQLVERPRFEDEDDGTYGQIERTALLSAMLEAAPCPVLNRPTGTSPAGPVARDRELLILAARCRLPVRSGEWTAEGTVREELAGDAGTLTMVGERFTTTGAGSITGPMETSGGAEAAMMAGCRRLGELLGCRFLQLQLAWTADGHCVVERVEAFPTVIESPVATLIASDLIGTA